MLKVGKKKLLKDPRVQQEIDRYKWIESEKAGHDIGYDRAADAWIKNYADDWETKYGKKKERRVQRVTRKISKLFS